ATDTGHAIDFDTYDQLINQRLQSFGIDISSDVVYEQRVTPQDIEQTFFAYHGSLYG
ncbi:MAG TPA: phytoene desaturase, partial [Exiguobacterium sp.]|nr:phytoene desaturase [Exiguobacterium sp.]